MITDEDEIVETTDQLDDEGNENHVTEAAPADDEIEEIIDALEDENEEDDKVGTVPANTPSTPAPPAEQDSEEMVTDKDIEDILDAVEDEDEEDNAGKADEKDNNGEKEDIRLLTSNNVESRSPDIETKTKNGLLVFRLVASVFKIFSTEVLGYDIYIMNQTTPTLVQRPLQSVYSSTSLQDSDLTFRKLSSCTNPL